MPGGELSSCILCQDSRLGASRNTLELKHANVLGNWFIDCRTASVHRNSFWEVPNLYCFVVIYIYSRRYPVLYSISHITIKLGFRRVFPRPLVVTGFVTAINPDISEANDSSLTSGFDSTLYLNMPDR